ncbi:ATP-binding cassette domain-containing protein [Peptacetobacter hominis]|uniref:ATP-binding cassette domain-containing protein n=1 Tax=Peptacetobacter hominis TaxID=2743610 RepID=A0A544QTQ1_9FIRM|nr:ATP-binding cassette domain-containing protein [Peptacetobacter hominis]TQQ84069.1 ATP-binding cassette domain-containing protein [Peptacetobacter hominis]
MIEIKNLNKFYGEKQILKNINLTIEDGEIIGIIGESGAGKSTLLNCLNRLEDFEEGSVLIDGKEIKYLNYNQLKGIRKNIGMIFQGFSLINRKSIYKNIAMPMECWGYKPDEIDMKILEVSKLVGLEDKLKCKPKELSGGQKQRVAIARALTQNPKILLCDECTSALDPANTKSILNLLKSLREKLNITIVIVTHEMSVIQNICDRVAIIKDGKLVQVEQVDKAFINKSEYLKELLGEQNIEADENYENIIISSLYNENNKDIIYQLNKHIKSKYIIKAAEFINTSKGRIFKYNIDLSEDDLETVIEYLDRNNINYFHIDRGEE